MSEQTTTLPPTAPFGGAISRESVLAQAMALPPADRGAIADALWSSIDRAGGEDDMNRYPPDPALVAECRRRLEAYDRGELQAVDPNDMFRRLDEKYGR